MVTRKKNNQMFKDEKKAVIAIEQSRGSKDFSALAVALETLRCSRVSQSSAAKNGKHVQVIESMEQADEIKEGGRYLVRPPLVARDAALIVHGLKSKGLAVLVVCREPNTQLGLCPVVSLGSGITLRIQIDAPKNEDKPTCAWFDHALDELGSHVIEGIKEEDSEIRQLDYLLAHLPSVSAHGPVYQEAIRRSQAIVE